MSLKVGTQADAGDNIKYCERAETDAKWTKMEK